MAAKVEVLPIGEAAEYLGVSRRKIWQLVKRGELPSRPDPLDRRRKLVRVEDLDKLREGSYVRYDRHRQSERRRRQDNNSR
ncbi:hypothetical protein HRbin08_02088 [bacterium HR08]|nr:hypothetical protein HRbin08_02088 [bacterium HR08]